jgi:hypothetical protein
MSDVDGQRVNYLAVDASMLHRNELSGIAVFNHTDVFMTGLHWSYIGLGQTMLHGAVDARGRPGWVIMDLKVDDWEVITGRSSGLLDA